MEKDYNKYYDLEKYLFDEVKSRFMENRFLSAIDFFCIVSWKSNRTKSIIAKKLLKLKQEYKDLDAAVQELTSELYGQANPKERLSFLIINWEFPLPTASAILAVLYPNEFTLYDVRVCDELGNFHDLSNRKKFEVNFENSWSRYQEFKDAVERETPKGLSLREKDQYLWGKSFYNQLKRDIDAKFEKPDTIVVRVSPEKFREDFLQANSYHISILSSMRTKIKRIAAYQNSPISSITHYAEVDGEIEKTPNNKKYKVKFKEPQKIGPIKLVQPNEGKALKVPKYICFSKLIDAKSLNELFEYSYFS